MKCEHCDIIERKNASEIIYEDNEVIVAIKDLVLPPGKITIFPKEHFTILELVPEHILEKCVSIANKVSIAIFDSLGCQGTNFLVQNGLGAGQIVPHFSIEIIPRIENDNLDLRWDTKPLPEDEMETIVMTLEKTLLEMDQEKLTEKAVQDKPTSEKPGINKLDADAAKEKNKDNYLLKSIRKTP